MGQHITLYDSTLRDGAQTQGVDFSVLDKQEIAQLLDALHVDYIEGGFPGANPTDDRFFDTPLPLNHAKLVGFGMTRRAGRSASNDPGLNALLKCGAKSVCIVGKSSAFHVCEALGITKEENLAMIRESVTHLAEQGLEVLFDAEHFFDGYQEDAAYAEETVRTAYAAGARWVVLCDTNGGTLPGQIARHVEALTAHIPGSHLGIHCHNDTENAVANSLAAVEAGVRQVQGTINGYGERCGNANLVSVIPTLMLKMGYTTSLSDKELEQLTRLSHALDDRLNRPRYRHAAYVGTSAFAHKGGLHVSAVLKHPSAYEHIAPETVGNRREILVSDQAGQATILHRLKTMGLMPDGEDQAIKQKIAALIDTIKEHEKLGYAYDGADASFELLARKELGMKQEFFTLKSFRVIDERRWNAKGKLVTISEAKAKVEIAGKEHLVVAEGNGPVDALLKALLQALLPVYPALEDIALTDYKVRIMKPEEGSGATPRVSIEMRGNKDSRWHTVGVSTNIIDASYLALRDGLVYALIHAQAGRC